jgi:hypothetical protein
MKNQLLIYPNKKGSVFSFLFFLTLVVGYAQKTPLTYTAFKAEESIQIDGLSKEKAWETALWSSDFIDIEGVKKPLYQSRMKMLWDEKYLYFFAELKEPHIWATLKQRDTVIFYNNDFEIFIDPDGDTHNYYEFEMNAHNTLWDLFLTKPYRNHGKIIDSWDIQGIKTAVQIIGTLNNPTDIDEGWTLEIAMPWSVLTEASEGAAIPVNKFWRLNFSRVNWNFEINDGRYARKKDKTTSAFEPEYNWVWSPQGVINMHEPEHWGYVYFANGAATNTNTFEIPKDDYIKWYLYEQYRTYFKYAQQEKEGALPVLTPKAILGETIAPKLETHSFGWTISVKSPFTQHILSIQEDGKFESHEEKQK